MSKLKEAALEYADLGWPIFPVRADKKPYTKNGVSDATTNKKKIKAWWGRWPGANIGLNVGETEMMVLDLDPGHSLKELEENVGKIPKTNLAATTPRGGKHLYFSLTRGETVPLSASKLAHHVDVRSFHSYVLLAPSKTADGKYVWDADPRDDDGILPAHRTERLIEAACAAKEQNEGWDDWLIEPNLEENVSLCIQWLKDEAQIAIEGVNGDHMAYSTAAMCKSFGMSPEMALDLMFEYWSPRCSPPWTEGDFDHLEQKVENGYSYNTSPPGNMTPAYKIAKAALLFSPVIRHTEGEGEEIKSGRFRLVDRAAMNMIKAPEWLIRDTIPQNSYSLLIGPRGTFKTFIALDMALSVATGGASVYADRKDWRGAWPDILHKGPVLFAAGEGRGNIVNRVRAWEKTHLDEDEVSNLFLIDPVPSPNVEDVTPFIEMALAKNDEYALVVLDTVGRSMQGLNENSQQDVSTFTKMIETIQYELDTAVLAIHHTGHGQTDRGRGSSVFGADVDAEFVLEREGKDYFVAMHNPKQKDAPEWEHPKVVELREIKVKGGKSLVAVKPAKDKRKEVQSRIVSKSRKGRSKDHREISISIVADVAYDLLQKYPVKEFSKNTLALGIAKDERICLKKQAIYKSYVDDLLVDKSHPISKCYDVGISKWRYVK